MKKSLKKVLALMLALAVILATFKVAPASNVEAKSTKYKAGSVYITSDSKSGYDTTEVWKSVPKTRVIVYGTGHMYVYYSNLAEITNVKVKGKTYKSTILKQKNVRYDKWYLRTRYY